MDNKDDNIFDIRKKLKNDDEKVDGLYEVNIEKYNKQLEKEKKFNKVRRICFTIFLIPWLSFLIPLTIGIIKSGDLVHLLFLIPFWIVALVVIFVGFIVKF